MTVFIFAAVSLTTGVTIQCDFQNVTWSIFGSQYTCFPATIAADDGNQTLVIDITGDHESGRTNADVKAFVITSSHQHLNRIPKGIEKIFPNLLVFAWEAGNLTTLTADDLEAFPELQFLYVDINKLVSLNDDLFKHTPKLRYIEFSTNLLERVGLGLLDRLSNLTHASFNDNSCINFNGTSPAAIQELKFKLQNQCSPLATLKTTSSTSPSLAKTTTITTSTESEHYSIECIELIETLVGEIKTQGEKIARQDKKIAAQSDTIKELERQIREL